MANKRYYNSKKYHKKPYKNGKNNYKNNYKNKENLSKVCIDCSPEAQLIRDFTDCGECKDVVDIGNFKVKGCESEYRLDKIKYIADNLPGVEYVLGKIVSYIFSSGLTTGSLDGDEELNELLHVRNQFGMLNKEVIRTAVYNAHKFGECGVRKIGKEYYIVKPGTYQTLTTYRDGVEIVIGYLISEKGRYIGRNHVDMKDFNPRDVETFINDMRRHGYVYIGSQSGEFLNVRDDPSKIHGDPKILKDKQRVQLCLDTYRRLNYDVIYDGTGRLILRVKNGFLEAENGKDVDTTTIMKQGPLARKQRHEDAQKKVDELAKTVKESSSDSIILLDDTFGEKITPLPRITKSTELLTWLQEDVDLVCQMFSFDATLAGLSKVSANVSRAATIDDAMLNCVVPLRENYALQFSEFLVNDLSDKVKKVYFNKYELQQTESTIDKLDKIVGLIYKLQVGTKKDPNADTTLLKNLSDIANNAVHDERGDLKALADL